MTFIACRYVPHLLWEDEVVIVRGQPYCKKHAKDVTLIEGIQKIVEEQVRVKNANVDKRQR